MNRRDIAALVARLVAINSANPATQADGAGESEIAAFCAQWLRAHGVEANIIIVQPARPAVIASLRGSGGGRKLLLLGHLDTHRWYPPPGRHEKGRVYGAGAFDMKGGIAVALIVLARLVGSPHAGDVSALLVPDEEHASLGIRALVPSVAADAAIVLEGTGLDLGISQSGRVRITLTATAAGTMSRGELMLRVLGILGHGTRHSGLRLAIHDAAMPRIVLQRRVASDEDAGSISARLAADLGMLPGIAAVWDIRESFGTDPYHAIVTGLARHVARNRIGARMRDLDHWTEAGVVASNGIPCVVFGPGGGGAHTEHEWVDIDDVVQASRILFDMASEYCG